MGEMKKVLKRWMDAAMRLESGSQRRELGTREEHGRKIGDAWE